MNSSGALTWTAPQGNIGDKFREKVAMATASMASLDSAVAEAKTLKAVSKQDLREGDCLFVTTRNSTYTVWSLCEGQYWVWGGWFDKQGISPQRVGINGCTWGGSIIKQDIIAAIGLRLEFGNRVRTTEIQRIQVVKVKPASHHN